MAESAPRASIQRVTSSGSTGALIRSAARRMTAERGLSGYTIQDLCDEVGVSRRTFFNYFASKENAIFGLQLRRDEGEIEERFAANNDGLDLLDALAALYIARWSLMDLSPDEAHDMFAAIDREPRLLADLLKLAGEQESGDVGLVARREGAGHNELRASTAVQMASTILRAAVTESFQGGPAEAFRDVFFRHLTAARQLFTS